MAPKRDITKDVTSATGYHQPVTVTPSQESVESINLNGPASHPHTAEYTETVCPCNSCNFPEMTPEELNFLDYVAELYLYRPSNTKKRDELWQKVRRDMLANIRATKPSFKELLKRDRIMPECSKATNPERLNVDVGGLVNEQR